MSDLDLSRLRQAALTPSQIAFIRALVAAGGEAPVYVDRLRPETREQKIAELNELIASDYVEVVAERSSGHRWMIRLTDEGRSLWSTGIAALEQRSLVVPVTSPSN